MSCSSYSSTRNTEPEAFSFGSPPTRAPLKSTAMSSSCTACAWPRSRSKIKISRAANAHASADAKDAGLIFFRATRRPFRASSAHSYTAPYVPWPTFAILLNDVRSRGPSSNRSASPACALSQAGHARASRGVSHAEADLDFFSPPRFATETRTEFRSHFAVSNFVQTPSRTGAPRAALSRESDSSRSRRTARPSFGSTEEPAAVAFAREDGTGSPASSRASGGGSRGAEAHAPMVGRARVGQERHETRHDVSRKLESSRLREFEATGARACNPRAKTRATEPKPFGARRSAHSRRDSVSAPPLCAG